MSRYVDVGEVVAAVYAAGARLVVLESGIGVEGDLPKDLRKMIRDHRDQLLEAITGDPCELFSPADEARTALYRQALQYLQERVVRRHQDQGPLAVEAALDRATKAMCRREVADRLNTAWADGSFEEFRDALREHVGVALKAAKGTAGKMKFDAKRALA